MEYHRVVAALCGVLPLSCVAGLTGCGADLTGRIQQATPSVAITGQVMGGQNPIIGATVGIFAFGDQGYGSGAVQLATTQSQPDGSFQFASGAYTCPAGDPPVYLLAMSGDAGSGQKNPNAVLGTSLGTCSEGKTDEKVLVNEVTTVALAYSLSHFFNTTIGGTAPENDSFGGPSYMDGAGDELFAGGIVEGSLYTVGLIANSTTGDALASSATVTTESAKVNTLANALAACVVTSGGSAGDGSACGNLFQATTPPGGSTAPTDTLQAAVEMALNPTASVMTVGSSDTTNVAEIYKLGTEAGTPFAPGLTSLPNDLSLAVSFKDSGLGLGIDTHTMSNLDVDQNGNVWFTSTASGKNGVAYFSPMAPQSFNGPYNTTTMVHPNEVAIDGDGYVWVTDTQGTTLSAYNSNAPGNTLTEKLNTPGESLALNIASDSTINVGVDVNGTYGLATVSSDRLSDGSNPYTMQTVSLPSNMAPYALATDAASSGPGDLFYSLANTASAGGFTQFYLPAGSANPTEEQSPSDAPGQVIYTGSANGLVAVTAWNGTSADGFDTLCFESTSMCDPLGVLGTRAPVGAAVDGAGALWFADSADATVQEAPLVDGSYVTSGQVKTMVLNHDAKNGGTLTSPEGIAVDFEGNVWVSNAGCVGSGCTPGPFVLTEIIGAAAPTITPVSAQIQSGANDVGTEPAAGVDDGMQPPGD